MSDDLERRLRDVPVEFPRPDATAMRELEERLLARTRRPRLPKRLATAAALLAAVGVGAGIGYWARPASAIEAATFRSVDVTMICTTVTQFGIREVTIQASPRVVTPTWDRPAQISLLTGSAGATEPLAGAEARGSSGRPRGGVFLHRTRCAGTQARVPLSRDNLAGAPSAFARSYECGAPRRVIVRVRASVRSPGPWVVGGENRSLRLISRDVISAEIAVRTWPGRKPLGFVTFDRREQTKLWAAYGCR